MRPTHTAKIIDVALQKSYFSFTLQSANGEIQLLITLRILNLYNGIEFLRKICGDLNYLM